jgi:hypothetical protein
MKKINSNTKIIILVACLLLVIIVSGIITLQYLKSSANELEQTVKEACVSIGNNEWELAGKQLDDFENDWDKTKYGWAILIDHFEIDNINDAYTKSKKYVETKDMPSALAELEVLRQYILHIPKREGFSLVNIL